MFQDELKQKYNRELLTSGLTTENVNFLGSNTIKIPFLNLKGYKNHSRAGGFNRQSVSNENYTKVLSHDRDVEFFVDTMDVDETNQVLAATNLTEVFETEHAIPEVDAYRISKIYAEYLNLGGKVDDRELNRSNVLDIYDGMMQKMDEEEVPESGRILYVTPATNNILRQSADISRFMNMAGTSSRINRNIRMLDEVEVVMVPPSRMKSHYNFDDGFSAKVDALQINMLLIHPSAVVAANKHSYIKLWTPGSHTLGDGYLYQNRQYGDLFVINSRVAAIGINAN